jgi:hypothetical protein
MGPTDLEFGALTPEENAETLRQARVDRALQAGWVIRYDPLQDEYTGAREMYTARTLDQLLDAIEGA